MTRSARVSSKLDLTTPSREDLELSMYLVAQLVTMFTLLGQRLSTSVPPIFLSKLLPWYGIWCPIVDVRGWEAALLPNADHFDKSS